MYRIPAAIATSLLVSFLIIPIIIKIFKKRGLFDEPGGRKIHKKQTPTMGGIAIFAGMGIGSIIWISLDGLAGFKYLFGAIFISFITGLRDDLIPLKPIHKLLGQIIAAGMVIVLEDIRLRSLYGFFGVYEIPYVLSVALTLFTIIVITNSFNLIDGLDGLAGTLSLIAFLFFGVWFYLHDQQVMAIIMASFVGALIGFLMFNWEPSKIFMGDTGALVIGFAMAIAAIYFIDYNYTLAGDDPYKFTGGIGTAIAVIIMPLFDTLRVFISRTMRGQSPFSPDKTHIHHLIMRMGVGHAGTVLIMDAINLLFIALVLLLSTYSDHVVLPAVVIFAVMLSLLLDFILSRRFPKKITAKKFRRR